MRILKRIVRKLTKLILKLKKRKSRLIFYFLFSVVMIMLFMYIFNKYESQANEKWFIKLSNFFVVITAISISALVTDSMIGIATYFEEKYYDSKAKNMMDSYRNWVVNSKYGDSYRLLNYLDNTNLTVLINEKDEEYRKEQGKKFKVQTYINDLRYNKVFSLYNDVIIELSKKPLFELKNMLSFIELSPKKNWLFALIKTIIIFFVPASTFNNIDSIIEFLSKKSFVKDFSLPNNVLNNLIGASSDSSILFLAISLFVFIIAFICIFILMFKDTKFDEPHIREYLKSSITRAIEIKTNDEETESF